MNTRLSSLTCTLLALLLVLAPATQSGAGTGKKAVPPTQKELVGVWIRFDSDDLTFTRLDLRDDGTGYCARVSPSDTILHDQGAHLYRITKWTLTGWSFDARTVAASNATRIDPLKGQIVAYSLRLTMRGPESGGWKEALLLNPESRIAASNQEAKKSIDEAENKR
jgi:hypothetical protein